jgi:hypothetical protein
MEILDSLLHSGSDLLSALGGTLGADKLLSFFDSADAISESQKVLLESADAAIVKASPQMREALGRGILAYLRNFHHSEADAAAAHAHDLTEVGPVHSLLMSVLTLQPRFFQDVARYLLRGAPSEACSEHGPQAWLLSLVRAPMVAEFFKSMLANVSSRVLN